MSTATRAPRDPYGAIADPTRRSILDLLREHDTLTAGEIAARYPRVTRAAVSKHLGVLRRSRLVRARQHGREWRYSLDARPLAAVYEKWLRYFAPYWDERLESLRRRVESQQ
jgi:DNA-binding transcriptional ArsR family regulator